MGTVACSMSSKQQVVLISLVFLIDVSLSELATCNPQNRECSCADTSSRDCEDFFPSERFHVDNIEKCMELCQTLNPLGQCEWLLFHYSPAREDKSFIPPYLNCELFATDDASLDQYLNTSDKHGQPTRRHDGSCTVNATNPSTGECNASICPSGCAPCDESDDCHRQYHETECGMLSPAIRLEPNVPDFSFCLSICTGTQDATYATWSYLDHTCACYNSGERLCRRQAVQFGFSQDDIDQCIAEPGIEEGILVIGCGTRDSASQSVEFWSGEKSCQLNNYPRQMMAYPTVNLVFDKLVACFEGKCQIYQDGTWQYLTNVLNRRTEHSSVAIKDAVLLIGGGYTYSTEWIPIDGSPGSLGPFETRHGSRHCTMKINEDVIVMTGGMHTENYVTEYRLTDGGETPFAPLGQGRDMHACGVYIDKNGQQVLLVTGGRDPDNFDSQNRQLPLSSTEVATYNTGTGDLYWRKVETGDLPLSKYGLMG